MFRITVIEINKETVKLSIEVAPGQSQTRILGVGASCDLTPSNQRLIDHLASKGVMAHKTVVS